MPREKHQHYWSWEYYYCPSSKFEKQQSFNRKVSEAVANILHWQSLLHSLRKANDHSYGFHNCDEYKATSKHSLINIKSFKDIRQKNLGKTAIGHLNINSIRRKFDSLIEIITGNIDILMISETKLDGSFPKGQFLIKEFIEPI